MVIVALTGFSHSDARRRTEEAGFDEHAVKPLTLSQLAVLMEHYAGRMQP